MEQKLYITDSSALSFWRWYRTQGNLYFNPLKTRKKMQENCAYKQADVIDLLHQLELPQGTDYHDVFGKRLIVGVTDCTSKSQSLNITSRVFTFKDCPYSFMALADNVYVSSPEACLVQCITRFSPEKALMLSMEFAGSYGLTIHAEGAAYDYNLNPITSKKINS